MTNLDELHLEVLVIIEDMDIPEMRKDLNKLGNLRWLQHNLMVRNGNHPRATEVLEMIVKMSREKNKQNQQVVRMPAIPEG